MSEELPVVTLARIEGKLDLLNAAIIRGESRGDDHEARIRALEARPAGVTPAKFLSTAVAFGSLGAAIAAVAAFLSR